MHGKFKFLILVTAIMGALSVILGAFGSHILASKLEPTSLSAFKTGVEYQFIHTLAIFGTALLYRIYRIKGIFYIGLYFLVGIVLFSGSLYILALKDLIGIENTKYIGLLTPLGGLALIASWFSIFLTVIRIKI